MKISSLFKAILFLIVVFSFHNAYSKTIYVAMDGDGSSGSSWATAYTNVQTAIDVALSGDDIWVKEGKYFPNDADRTIAITLKSGVRLYGGFTADEATVDDRPMLDLDSDGIIEPWEFSSPTTLSGEIQNDGDKTNNSQHILIIPDGSDVTTLVNGFTIEDGYSDALSTVTGIGTYMFASGVIASGGKVSGCIIQNCESNSVLNGYGGGVVAVNAKIESCVVEGCSLKGDGVYGGGVYVNQSNVQGTWVSNCDVVSIGSSMLSSKAGGGGLYSVNCVIDSSFIRSNSANSEITEKAFGGGMYNSGSNVISCQVFDNKIEGNEGVGGGVYGSFSTYINTVIFNNESSSNGGGINLTSSFFTNGVVVNNKTNDTNKYGGGGYGDSETSFYNTVFKGNQASISAQLRVVTGADIVNCAFEGSTQGTNGMLVSTNNDGSEDGVFYCRFISPSTFVGNTNGDAAKETELAATDWNISMFSDLIEKGNNVAFTEAHSAVGTDLNGDGDKNETIDHFADYANEMRLFNKNVDIGAFEPAFVDLTLPAPIEMEYGKTLGEITLTGGSAVDLRNSESVAGSYSFTDSGTRPAYNGGVATKYRVVFTPVDNVTYTVVYDSLFVTISKKELTLSGLTAEDKVYDGTSTVSFSGSAILEGVVGTDDVTLLTSDISAAFEDKHAGVDKNVIFSGYELSGVDKGNYELSLAGATATIFQKPVSMTVLTAEDKIYDGTTVATYVETPEVIGEIAGDDVSIDVNSGTASFDSKTEGGNKTVTFEGFALTGTDALNYILTQPSNSQATISKLAVTVEGVSAADKVYDAKTNATIEGIASVNGIISGDDVTLNANTASATFDNKNVGANKSVEFSGYELIGADAGNYALSQPVSDQADITAKELAISGISIQDKDYDGTTDATLSGNAVLNGVETGDDVTLNSASLAAAFVNANAGDNKEVNLTGYELQGVDKTNYTLEAPGITATINKIALSVKADDKSKTFGEADPELTYALTSGALVAGDGFSGSLSRESGDNAGIYDINQGSLALSANYDLTFTAGVFTINKAPNAISFVLNSPVTYEEGLTITLDATSDSPNDVSYLSSDQDIVSVDGNIITIRDYGIVTITAEDNGNNNYKAASSITYEFEVIPEVKALRKGSNMLIIDNSDNFFASYQWYRNGSLINGEIKQYYYSSNELQGDYYCIVTTTKGDKFNSNTINISSLSAIQVYPSPALKGAEINVKLEGYEHEDIEKSVLKVYSLTGKMIIQLNDIVDVNQITIDQPGIYIIKTEGAVQTCKKLIVK